MIDDEVNSYISYLKYERCYTEGTISGYTRVLNKACTYLSSLSVTTFAGLKGEVKRGMLSCLRVSADGKELATNTVAFNLKVLSAFYTYLGKRFGFTYDPMDDVVIPRPQTLPRVLSLDEMSRLIEASGKHPDAYIAARDQAIAVLLYDTGLRVSELAALAISDIDLALHEAKVVQGKGRKDRMVVFGQHASDLIEAYLIERAKLNSTEPYLFLSNRGHKLTRQDIHAHVQEWAKLAGIDGKVTPHSFRHACATHMVMGGADTRTVQELLGHASLETTQIYLHCDYKYLQDVVNSAHPRANTVPNDFTLMEVPNGRNDAGANSSAQYDQPVFILRELATGNTQLDHKRADCGGNTADANLSGANLCDQVL